MVQMDEAFKVSALPDEPDRDKINELLIACRKNIMAYSYNKLI